MMAIEGGVLTSVADGHISMISASDTNSKIRKMRNEGEQLTICSVCNTVLYDTERVVDLQDGQTLERGAETSIAGGETRRRSNIISASRLQG